jgi:hypothetical protein
MTGRGLIRRGDWDRFVRLAHRDPITAGTILAAVVLVVFGLAGFAVALIILAGLGLLAMADAWWSLVAAGGWCRAAVGLAVATLAALAILTRESP